MHTEVDKFIDAALERSAVAVVAVCIGLLLSGCGKERPVWSTSVRSPDGGWRAVAETYDFVGPGNNDVETFVRIEGDGGNTASPSRVLAISDGGKYLGLSLKWLTSRHLLISLKEQNPILVNYQVVKLYGIEVSVRNEYTGLPSKSTVR